MPSQPDTHHVHASSRDEPAQRAKQPGPRTTIAHRLLQPERWGGYEEPWTSTPDEPLAAGHGGREPGGHHRHRMSLPGERSGELFDARLGPALERVERGRREQDVHSGHANILEELADSMAEPRITALMPVKNYHPGYLAKSPAVDAGPDVLQLAVADHRGAADLDGFRQLLARELADPGWRSWRTRDASSPAPSTRACGRPRRNSWPFSSRTTCGRPDAIEVLHRYHGPVPGGRLLPFVPRDHRRA